MTRTHTLFSLSKLAHLRSRRRQYPSEDPYASGAVTAVRSGQQHNRQTPSSVPSSFSSPSLSSLSLAGGQQEVMTGRDRTAEFTSVVHSLQSYHVKTVYEGAKFSSLFINNSLAI